MIQRFIANSDPPARFGFSRKKGTGNGSPLDQHMPKLRGGESCIRPILYSPYRKGEYKIRPYQFPVKECPGD